MGKYIIEVGDAYAEYICGKGDMLCLPVRINEFEDNWLNTDIPLTPYTEPDTEKVREEAYKRGREDAIDAISSKEQSIADKAYQSGLSDAWEAAKKIALMDTETSENVTGYFGLFRIMENLTPMQAIEKIRQYEQEKEQQIQVGDEVILDGRKYVVLVVDEDGIPEKLLEPDGYTLTLTTDVKLPKTGRHYPQIAEVLAKMKEES